MKETSKLKKLWNSNELSYFKGKGIDIGCGTDPVFEDVYKFDIDQGDANKISDYVKKQFDFVYSSHCLEHMDDPNFTISEWWKLVKPGGFLIVIVPDEDLYEQGIFPSISNPDHKATFTISKRKSWSPKSYNVLDLVNSLPGGELLNLELQDNSYDRTLMCHKANKRQVNTLAHIIFIFLSFLKKISKNKQSLSFIDYVLRYDKIIDQTLNDKTLAQIQCVVKKI